MKAYHIYFLRHGMTEANLEGRYIGRTNVPLSDIGEQELSKMADKYKYPGAALYFSSPMKRCIQSFYILYPDVKPEIVEDFRECDFGEYEGKAIEELKGDEQYKKWAAGSLDSAPGGEKSKDFQLRCCAAFEKIVDKLMRSGSDSAVIMAHGGTIMSILGQYAFPRKPMFEWMAGSGMGFEAVVTPQLWMSGKAIEIASGLPFIDKDAESDYRDDAYDGYNVSGDYE